MNTFTNESLSDRSEKELVVLSRAESPGVVVVRDRRTVSLLVRQIVTALRALRSTIGTHSANRQSRRFRAGPFSSLLSTAFVWSQSLAGGWPWELRCVQVHLQVCVADSAVLVAGRASTSVVRRARS